MNRQKTKKWPWGWWFSLTLNVLLIGSAMNFVAVSSNGMKMPVFMSEFDAKTIQFSNDPSLVKHVIITNMDDFTHTPYFLLGDYIYFRFGDRENWMSLGDIYIIVGLGTLLGLQLLKTYLAFRNHFNKRRRRR